MTGPARPGLLGSILPAAALVPAASAVVAVALPTILGDLPLGTGAIWWLVTGYLLVAAALQAPLGRLGDRTGQRRVLLSGTGLLAAASLGAAIAPGPAALVGARLLQAVGGAATVPAGLALLRRGLPAATRGRAVGRFLTATAAGAGLGVTAGGVLVTVAGWRAPFLALAVLAAAALVPAAGVPRTRRSTGAPPRARQEAPGRRRWLRLVVPATGVALVNLTLYVVLLIVPLRLDALGLSATVSGGVLGVFVVTTALGTLLETRASRPFGRRRSAAVGTAGAGLALLAAAPISVPVPWLFAGLLLAGGGLGTGVSGLFTLGLDSAGRRTAGTDAGMLSTARYVGSITGTATLPVVIGAGGHTAGLLLAGAAALLAAPMLALGDQHGPAPPARDGRREAPASRLGPT